MTNQEAIEMLTAKAECIRREASGTDIDCNLRNCDECDLCYKQGTMGDQMEALGVAISALQAQEETVSRKVYEQISWERDIAVMQLKDLGYGLGEKIRTDGDMISRRGAIEAVSNWLYDRDDRRSVDQLLSALPSAQPEIKPIDYQDCANAMMMMWIDNVLTDGEYRRIMDKLNDHESRKEN